MDNNLASNISTVVQKSIAGGFENSRVTSKTINTENIRGAHTNETGDTIYRKRKASYRAVETSDGDISGTAPGNDILSGRIAYVVQDLITVDTEWGVVEEALELNQMDELVGVPMGEELVTRLELNVNEYMKNNAGLTLGDPDNVVNAWSDVAAAKARMNAIGVPAAGQRYYQMNDETAVALAGVQVGVPAQTLSKSAFQNAVVSSPFGGITPLTSNSLKSLTNGTCTDRVGDLASNPDVTWATAKDTMTQVIAVQNFTAAGTIKAGEIIEVTGRYHTNPRTQQTLLDNAGNPVPFRWTVTADVTLSGGAGNVTVTNAAIFDAASNNQHDNVSSAPVSGDVITILGTASDLVQPNLFYHKDAFSLATIQLPRLYATDSFYTSKDGLSYRVSRFADGLANTQKMRVDMMYAIGVSNPLHAGRAYGIS